MSSQCPLSHLEFDGKLFYQTADKNTLGTVTNWGIFYISVWIYGIIIFYNSAWQNPATIDHIFVTYIDHLI